MAPGLFRGAIRRAVPELSLVLVRFGLDADGVRNLGEHNSSGVRTSQRLFASLLARNGVLIFADKSDRQRLIEAVRVLPQELRSIWSSALVDVARMQAAEPSPTALSCVQTIRDLTSWRKTIAVALVGPHSAQSAGLKPEQATLFDEVSEIELARLLLADSGRLRAAIATLEDDVQRGESREEVWSNRFSVAASTELPVTILDRYATSRLRRTVRQGGDCGLAWFLSRVAADTNVPVHLIAEASTSQVAAGICSDLCDLRSKLPNRGLKSLSVTLAPERVYRQYTHARHIRFGHFTICLDRGLSMFDRTNCPYSMPCPRVQYESAQQREKDVETNALTGYRRKVLW
jgi:hypothetical protein